MGKLKKESGITLIALVVTIIVLLILAGISVSMITGENGILKKAGEASEKTKIATDKEQRRLARYEAGANIDGMVFQGVTIPAGFAPTRIEGETTIDEGLVVTDVDGNEYVWIPCEYDSESVEGVADENTVYYNDSSVEHDQHDNRDPSWKKGNWYYNGGTWYDEQPHSKTVKNSITKYHGFYVARYEAGVPKKATEFYVDPEGRGNLEYKYQNNVRNDSTKIENGEIIPVSQKGSQAWNYITQENAEKAARKMVTNRLDVQSYLIDSHAWNTICRLLEKKYKSESNKVTNSTNWGNYANNTDTKYEKIKGLWARHTFAPEKGWRPGEKYNFSNIPKKGSTSTHETGHIELATGICEDFKAYNIYDMAGNMWEWTTEEGNNNGDNTHNGSPNCNEGACPNKSGVTYVLRGGAFNIGGDSCPVVSVRGDYYNERVDIHVGFRAVLYLK